MTMHHLVFTGIQGCGKGAQARLLREKYEFEIVEMGQEFRNEVAQKTELGKEIQRVMDAGYLVDDELGGQIMQGAIESRKSTDRVIFDGFIRKPWNKVIFDTVLPDYRVIFFRLSEEKAQSRLLGRVFNPRTGATFTAGTLTDPATGETLIQRQDDKDESSIRRRIEEYTTHTLPLVEAQIIEGRVIEIDADQSIEMIHQDLVKALGL